MGIPSAMPRADVKDLLARYLNGDFDTTRGGLIPIGARVCIMEGQFENWLATVTGRTAGGRYTVKPMGQQVELRKAYQHSLRPAAGFDLARSTRSDIGVRSSAQNGRTRFTTGTGVRRFT